MSEEVLEQFNLIQMPNPEEDALAELIEFRDSKEGEAFISWMKNQFQQIKSGRSGLENQWAENLSFFFRKDHAGVGIKPPQQKGTKKIFVNRIRAVVRTEISKLTSQLPQFTVVPSSSEEEYRLADSAGEQVVISFMHTSGYTGVIDNAAFWLSTCGNAFVKTYWDPEGHDASARPGPEDINQAPGEIQIEAVTPFNFFVPDVRQVDLEKQPFVIHANVVPAERARQMYEKELEGKELTSTHLSKDEIVSSSTLNLPSDAKPDSVVLLEFWVKPLAHKLFPEGGSFILAGETLVGYYPVFPYDNGRYPFAHIGGIPTGTFYRASTVEDLIPLQIEYNANVSLVRNTRHIHGKPALLAQTGSITGSKMSNTYGNVYLYRAGTPMPTVMPSPELPSYIFDERDRIIMDIEDLSGQHQVSKGSTPPGVTAATAISYLQERDDSFISTYYKSMEKAVEKIGQTILALAIQYWDIPRMIKVVGADQLMEVTVLKNTDLRNNTDVRTEIGSNVPESMAARRAYLMDLTVQGIIQPEEFLELSEIGGASRIVDGLKIDKRQAQRENIMFKSMDVNVVRESEQSHQMQVQQMQMQNPEAFQQLSEQNPDILESPSLVAVNEWDNHEIHIETHNNFRKSQEYTNLEPEIQEQIEKHVNAHKLAQQQNMLEQMLSQIPSDGSTPGLMGVEDEYGDIQTEEAMPGSSQSQVAMPGQGTLESTEGGEEIA